MNGVRRNRIVLLVAKRNIGRARIKAQVMYQIVMRHGEFIIIYIVHVITSYVLHTDMCRMGTEIST